MRIPKAGEVWCGRNDSRVVALVLGADAHEVRYARENGATHTCERVLWDLAYERLWDAPTSSRVLLDAARETLLP